MKKSLIYLLALTLIVLTAISCSKGLNSPTPIAPDSTLTADYARRHKTTPTTPVVTPPVTAPVLGLSAEENLFDDVHFVQGSLGFNGTKPTTVAALNNQEVGTIKAVKGGLDMIYQGRTVVVPAGSTWPPLEMDGKIPVLISDDGGPGKWLSFKNVTSTQYESAGFTGIPAPYEVWFVFRYMPGQSYEALFEGGGNAAYVGDLASSMRIINPGYGTVTGSVKPTLYTTHIGRLLVNSQSLASWYLDGKFIGSVAIQSPDLNNMIKYMFNVGVVTHQSDWDFAAMYFKKGAFSTTDATTIYNSLAAKWAVGTIPNQILLSNIQYSSANGVYTPKATVINTPTGVTLADPSKWDYQWYQDDGELDRQTLFSTAYQPSSTALNPSLGTHVKVLIRPKDINGNVWRFFEGTYP